MKLLRYAILLVSLLISHQLYAQATSPDSVIASSTFSSYSLPSLINEDGLTGGLEGGLHSEDFPTMWMSGSGDLNATLTFDMGQVVNLTDSYIWQYNAACCGLNRGVDGFDILYSQNGVDYTAQGSANLTQSPGGAIAAQVVPVNVTARFIRFEITSNHGDGSFVGLSEVAFVVSGEPPVAAAPAKPVPGLSIWTIALLSFFILVVAYRRYRLN